MILHRVGRSAINRAWIHSLVEKVNAKEMEYLVSDACHQASSYQNNAVV